MDLSHCKGPRARRSVQSIMESDSRNPNSSSFRNQKKTVGWRLGSNEELNRAESESDDYDDSESSDLEDEAHIKAEAQWRNMPYGWKLKQKSSNCHVEASYKQNGKYMPYGRKLKHEELIKYIPECATYDSENNELNLTDVDLNKIHQQSSPNTQNYQEEIPLKSYNWIYISFAILMTSVIIYLYFFTDINSESLSNEKRLRDEIKNIHSEFRSQEDDIWYTFSSGIKDVEGDPSHPSVFLILYDGGEDTPTCLAIKIAKVAMNFLNVTKPDPIVLDGLELGKNKTLKNDYGELIAEEKQRVEEYRTMIVKNIHKVPGKVAQSFHSFCDTYTPLVDKAVYLFTLHAVGASDTHHPTALAEEELEQSWKKELHEDILKPLITRITDNVVVIKSEKHLPSSCKKLDHL